MPNRLASNTATTPLFPPSPIVVEFRPFIGPNRKVKVSAAQWHGEACIVNANCSGQLESVGALCNTAAAPGSLDYHRPAYAHMACLRPEERWVPAHSRCTPTVARTT